MKIVKSAFKLKIEVQTYSQSGPIDWPTGHGRPNESRMNKEKSFKRADDGAIDS